MIAPHCCKVLTHGWQVVDEWQQLSTQRQAAVKVAAEQWKAYSQRRASIRAQRAEEEREQQQQAAELKKKQQEEVAAEAARVAELEVCCTRAFGCLNLNNCALQRQYRIEEERKAAERKAHLAEEEKELPVASVEGLSPERAEKLRTIYRTMDSSGEGGIELADLQKMISGGAHFKVPV